MNTFCPECGSQRLSTGRFCPHCGFAFPVLPQPANEINTSSKDTTPILKGQKPSAETEAMYKEIMSNRLKNFQSSSDESFNEAAKQMIGMEGILVGLYFNAIVFSNLRSKPLSGVQMFIYLAPIGFFLVSLAAALNVFTPKRLRSIINVFNISSLFDVLEERERKVTRSKMMWLRIASGFFLLGIVVLFFAVVVYLHG